MGGLAASYAALLATRLGVGIGEAVCTPAATSWIGDLVPASRRARAMAGFMMAVPVGIMLSTAIGGAVAQAHGWRMALGLAALPGMALAPANFLCLALLARGRLPGIQPGRQDVILAGVLLAREVCRLFGLAAVTVSEADLLDGVALSLAGE